ncbi:hypothetical protein GE061_015308, partial [Apolygus lucorum]
MNKDNHDIVEAIASGFRRLEVNWGLLDLDRDREADIADLFHARRGGPVVCRSPRRRRSPVGHGDIGAAQVLPAIDHRMIFGTLVPDPFLS